jgi:hypothetical protein
LLRALFSEYFFQDRRVAGVFDFKVDSIADVIEKGFKAGVSVALGGLIVALGEPGQKGRNLIWGDGFQISFTKFLFEATKQKFIVFYGIFFSN